MKDLACPLCGHTDLETTSIEEKGRLIPVENLRCQVCHCEFDEPITSHSQWMKRHLEEEMRKREILN